MAQIQGAEKWILQHTNELIARSTLLNACQFLGKIKNNFQIILHAEAAFKDTRILPIKHVKSVFVCCHIVSFLPRNCISNTARSIKKKKKKHHKMQCAIKVH